MIVIAVIYLPRLDLSKDENKYMNERNGKSLVSNFRTIRRSCSSVDRGSLTTSVVLMSFSFSNDAVSIEKASR